MRTALAVASPVIYNITGGASGGDGGGDGGGEGGAIGGGAAFDEDARFPLEVWRSVDVEITFA